LLDRLNSDGFDHWSGRLFHFRRSFLIMALVKSLGDAGLVGLIALAIIIWLFSGRAIAGPSAADTASPTEEK
jgi:hypothetical protein